MAVGFGILHLRRAWPLGLVLLYLAWFKQTFGFLGVAPTVNHWATPETTWLRVWCSVWAVWWQRAPFA